MQSVTLVDGTDLTGWANRRDAQSILPQLVRRLIHATVATISQSSFPAGEGVHLSGWDGKLVVERGNAFVPDGASVWEMSTERNVRNKADEDYTKRSQEPRGADARQTTFVFVTPRRWPGKEEWINTRHAEDVWREVRVYDADTLEEWLELAPAVHLWFSVLLGKRPENAVDLETFWADWSAATRPAIPPEFMLAGRDELVKSVQEWLRRPATQPLTLRAESRDESLAVFTAIVHQLPGDERIERFSRALVVRDLSSWEQLTASTEPLILVLAFDDPTAVARATRLGHRVVVPLGQADSVSDNTVNIPRLSWETAVKVLVTCGLTEEKARGLATLARRSLTVFRRKIAQSPELQQPQWASAAEARSLLPALLAGAWDDASEGDREALAKLAHRPYEEVVQTLVRWSNEVDPPVRRIGNTWFVISKEDAWSLLARYLTQDDMKRFEEVALEVLSAPDPRFDLGVDQRWMAKALGHAPRHSGRLHESLADTLALMGARGASTSLNARGVSISNEAAHIAQQILKSAHADWCLWASLSGVLPLVAEAAPDFFLGAIEDGLKGENPVLLKLFADDQDPLFSSSPHTGLLWALETLAWSAEHLTRAALLLARLARLDPGGRLSNRPENSLLEIFLPWHPQTAATLDQRLRVLDLIRERELVVAWRFMRQLLPNHHSIATNTAKPNWREWVPESSPGVTRGEYFKAIGEISTRMLADVGESGARWKDFVEALPNLPLAQHEAILERLTSLSSVPIQPEDRTLVWNALRKLISHHRSFHDAEWALPKERVDRIEAIFKRFEPQEPDARYGWLFDGVPELPEGREGNWEAHQEAVATARREAIQTIHGTGGLQAVLGFMERVKDPYVLGVTLGLSQLADSEDDALLNDHLAAAASRGKFARGFTVGRISSRRRAWAEAKLADQGRAWASIQRAEFLSCFPSDGRTWDLAESEDKETQQHFWRLVPTFGVSDDNVERVARKFLEYGRPYATVELLAFHALRMQPRPVELIADALEGMLKMPPGDDKPVGAFSYHVGELLDGLSSSSGLDENRIARLEWALLPVLGRQERNPRLLHRELGRNPDFFAEIITWIYRAEGEEPRDVSEEDQARARLAYELLESWRTVPGTADDGTVDGGILKGWVKRAREVTAASGRAVVAEHMIGQVLSGSPRGSDGSWPHPAVSDVIEECASIELERGIEIGLYNSRGVVQRSLTEGGSQERQLAEQYSGSASAVGDRWPRTAAMLRRIGEAYRADAKREDQEVELRQDLEW